MPNPRVPSHLFSTEGVSGVQHFWAGLLKAIASSLALAVAVGVVTGVVLVATGASPAVQQIVTLSGGILVGAFAVYSQVAVAVKRCHALGRSGWWCLLLLVPFVGPVWLLLDLSVRRAAEGRPAP